MSNWREYVGECIGTFILVFIGCGSIVFAEVLKVLNSVMEVAIVWGIAVSIAIYSVKKYCPAHINPAVSLAMVVSRNLAPFKLPFYLFSQLIGAMMAAILLYFFFNGDIAQYEITHNIIRGEDNSYYSAIMFGEFFPNPGFEDVLNVSVLQACFMEGLGTYILVIAIYLLVTIKNNIRHIVPLIIGLTITLLIIFIAPYTQGGFNPARDFGPRMVAYFGGWNMAAFPPFPFSFFTVYILSPFLGAVLACYTKKLFTKSIRKTPKRATN